MVDINFILLLVLSVALVVLGLFILLKSRREATNRYFFVMAMAIVGWLVANYYSNLTSLSPESLLVWNKAVLAIPALMSGSALIFVLIFTGYYAHVAKWLRISGHILPLIITILSFTQLIVRGISISGDGTIGIVFGPLAFVYFAFHLLFLALVIFVFWHALRHSQRAARARLKFVVAGVSVSFTLVLLTNLVAPLVFHSYALVGLGPYAILILISSFAYAIVRHRLFEVRPVVAISVVYVLLMTTLGLIFGAGVFISSIVLFPGASLSPGQTIVNIVIALIISAAFQPVRRFFQRVTDHFFYRDSYDSQEVLNNFSKVLVSELQLDRILKRSLGELCESLHIEFGQLIVFNNERVYRVEHFGILPKRLMVAPELAILSKPMLVADELPEGERRKLMETHGIRVSLTLRTRDEFVAYLLLGDKLSGDIYTSQDIELLEIIGKELAVAILNAKAYAEIEEFNRTLQARVDHATNRLRVANRHLKELDLAKDEFISMASHQLRTPLTTIKGYLSMLLEGDAGKISSTQKEFVNYAFTSSERMVNLISDLLNVSRLSAGRFLIQTKPTDMVLMIQDEVRQLKSHAAAKNLDLVFEPPKHVLPPAEIDENKTRQVVMNFIDNAIYYTPSGSVTVVLEQTGDRVRLEVRDTGIGVPEVARRKLFSKFFRADNAQTVRPDGTGLGLYLAKRVVEDQGGTIIFNSVEGKGSTFGFELPFKPQPIKHEDTRSHAKHK